MVAIESLEIYKASKRPPGLIEILKAYRFVAYQRIKRQSFKNQIFTVSGTYEIDQQPTARYLSVPENS